MFRRSRQKQQHQHHQRRGHSEPSSQPKPVVGTEATAKEQLERNRKEFKYPPDSVFEAPIENSLLYSMLKEPTIYPRDVLVQHINEEDLNQYLYYHHTGPMGRRRTIDNNNQHQQQQHPEEPLVSYAQLSALLGLSAEHYAPIDNEDHIGGRDEYTTFERRITKSDDAAIAEEEKRAKERDAKDVSKILGRSVLQCVIRYAQEHDLDRENEVNELLEPFAKYVQKRNINAELKAIASLYAGYSATLLTANPLPALAGLAVWSTALASRESEMRNFDSMKKETNRRANVETTGLLDEADDI